MSPQDPDRAEQRRPGLRHGFAAFVAMLLLATSLPSGAAEHVEREYAQAVRSFKAGRTSEAYGQFFDLANRGDVDSARIALFMHLYGQQLFGKHWDALPVDVAYWQNLVRNSGSSGRPAPEFPPTVLTPKAPRVAATSARGTVKPTSVARLAQ